MYILGISAYYHDSAAVLLKDDSIVIAVQEERFTRIKNDAAFPVNAIQYALKTAGITVNEIDVVTFYDKPLLKFERILETYLANVPRGFIYFLSSLPIWIREKLFLKTLIKNELKKIGEINFKKTKLLFTEHHLAHAASTFYTSPYHESAIVIIDGVGEWATTSICYGINNKIEVIKEIRFPHSLGLLYSSFTYFLGFKVNSAEYKVMGLAPYLSAKNELVLKFYHIIKDKLIVLYDDGSYALQMSYFSYPYSLKMIKDKMWEELFGIKKRNEEDDLSNEHVALATALQLITEEIFIRICEDAKNLSGSKNICLSGGVALNCVANSKLMESNLFENIYIQPAAGDAGAALGAALATYYIYFNKQRKDWSAFNPYLGYSIEEEELNTLCKKLPIDKYSKHDDKELIDLVVKALAEKKVIGWVQAKMEWGPRALGNRSILADPRPTDMQSRINLQIKKREGFRPFAPVILEQEASKYFEMKQVSPYMLFTFPFKAKWRNELPLNFEENEIMDKLIYPKSQFPAVTHIDFSARVQTVNQEQNKKLFLLLQAFMQETGVAMLINTSFNVRSEPIVMTAQQAFDCFMKTEMDLLVIENTLFYK